MFYPRGYQEIKAENLYFQDKRQVVGRAALHCPGQYAPQVPSFGLYLGFILTWSLHLGFIFTWGLLQVRRQAGLPWRAAGRGREHRDCFEQVPEVAWGGHSCWWHSCQDDPWWHYCLARDLSDDSLALPGQFLMTALPCKGDFWLPGISLIAREIFDATLARENSGVTLSREISYVYLDMDIFDATFTREISNCMISVTLPREIFDHTLARDIYGGTRCKNL